MRLVTGVIAAIIPIHWNRCTTSRVQMLWSTLLAGQIHRISQKCQLYLTPQHCAKICTPPCKRAVEIIQADEECRPGSMMQSCGGPPGLLAQSAMAPE